MNDGQTLHNSPYVEQIERFAGSVKQLSQIFLGLEEKKQAFSDEEIEMMFRRLKEKVCSKCEKCEWCWGENFIHTYQMGYEVLSAVDHYGNDLNTETKRKLMQRCIMAPRFLREMLEGFHDARQNMIWINRIARSREGCAIQLDTFADMLQSSARELEESIFTDERMERRISGQLKKRGVKVLYTQFFMNREGKYEVHVTARAMQKKRMTVRELVRCVSAATGRRFVAENDSAQMIGQNYMTVICREGPAYYTIPGVARIGKGCNSISGDNFAMMELPGGKKGVVLSDGMGSGETACRESTLVVELLEELLEAGFPEKTAINSTSLPIGVINSIEIDSVRRQLEDGDFIIMVTDGVMDALPVGEQDLLLETIIKGTAISNPKELAHHILQQVLSWTGREPEDDMTVLAVGIWKA